MTAVAGPEARHLVLRDGGVEVEDRPGSAGLAPLLLLHEGLGSVALWRGLPARLAAATGRRTVAWSRHGYGHSCVLRAPRAPSYMHQEALVVLPELLEALGVERPLLVGHSDGASIALIHAGGGGYPVAGIVAIAPHVVVEERSLAGIREARRRYQGTDLPARMARYHDDPDATFYGWNDVWLSAAFRDWSIDELLAGVAAPVLCVQAADDEYGTLEQLDRVEAGVAGPVGRLVLPVGGHAPHLTHPDAVVEAVAAFAGRLP